MKNYVIKGGRVIDPASGIDGAYDIYLKSGKVLKVVESASKDLPGGDFIEIEAGGKVVTPGFIDIHTHLRDPGFEYKETIKTGSESAAAGGFTTILCMANTYPVNDNESVTRYIVRKATEEAVVNVLPIGALSLSLDGGKLTEMSALKEAGCVAISDDGVNVGNPVMVRRGLEYASSLGLAVITHAEDHDLSGGGVMNEGVVSTRLGLKGIPNAAEDTIVARDISIAELTGGHIHMAHVSTKGAVDLIRDGKRRGIRVTGEVTPHHLVLTDEAVTGYDTHAKMSPPLRTGEDVDALREGLRDGTIDCIATDHAPHSSIEKECEFDFAANGIVGFETALPVVLDLVKEGIIDLNRLVESLTISAARVVGIDGGTLAEGVAGDITIFDPEEEWVVDSTTFKSKGRNTPFNEWRVKGRVKMTLVKGTVVYEDKGTD